MTVPSEIQETLFSDQLLVLIGTGLVTSFIADFVLENVENSCGDAIKEEKNYSQ